MSYKGKGTEPDEDKVCATDGKGGSGINRVNRESTAMRLLSILSRE